MSEHEDENCATFDIPTLDKFEVMLNHELGGQFKFSATYENGELNKIRVDASGGRWAEIVFDIPSMHVCGSQHGQIEDVPFSDPVERLKALL